MSHCRCTRPFSGYICDHCDRPPHDATNPFTCTATEKRKCLYCENYTKMTALEDPEKSEPI